jgi:hypothetical protein
MADDRSNVLFRAFRSWLTAATVFSTAAGKSDLRIFFSWAKPVAATITAAEVARLIVRMTLIGLRLHLEFVEVGFVPPSLARKPKATINAFRG